MDEPDFRFSFERAMGPNGPWSHLYVVRFDGIEELRDEARRLRGECFRRLGRADETSDPGAAQ